MQTPDGIVTARLILLNCSVDLPARAMVTNMKQWNGVNGCLYCEDQGTTIGTNHLHRYWPHQVHSMKRTHASLLRNAAEAVRLGTTVSIFHQESEKHAYIFTYI